MNLSEFNSYINEYFGKVHFEFSVSEKIAGQKIAGQEAGKSIDAKIL